MFGFTAFEVHDVFVVSFFVVRSFEVVSFFTEGGRTPVVMFKHSLLELLEDCKAPEMFEDNDLKSPTRPEVAGEEVVLVGEFEQTV